MICLTISTTTTTRLSTTTILKLTMLNTIKLCLIILLAKAAIKILITINTKILSLLTDQSTSIFGKLTKSYRDIYDLFFCVLQLKIFCYVVKWVIFALKKIFNVFMIEIYFILLKFLILLLYYFKFWIN